MIITIIGATGTQRGSAIKHLLQDSSSGHTIRAITRNPDGDKAQDLSRQGVQVVKGDLDDVISLEKAVSGSNAIFAVTDFWTMFAQSGKEAAAARETQQGKNIVDAAEATIDTLEHFIWSTLAETAHNSEQKAIVPHYESKVAVNRYIESKPGLLAKTTFLWSGYYASNFARGCLKPVYMPSASTFVQIQSVPGSTPMAFIGDTAANLGAFIKAIFEKPEETRVGRLYTPSSKNHPWKSFSKSGQKLIR
ncbi:hypothetical protein N7470_002866 [Penicillium chermesinum]|nr:hypothetical protein N7470_002866 [Penicillium chermesinum]